MKIRRPSPRAPPDPAVSTVTPVRLEPDARIAVIGGGPAGSFFALRLLDLVGHLGRPKPRITIFEHKRFSDAGPRGCNSCAGIVQSCMVEKVARLGVPIAPEVVQKKIHNYVYHARRGAVIAISARPAPYPILAMYRGNGPLFNPHAGNLSFDDYMLGVAEARGAEIRHANVTAVRLPPKPAAPVVLEWTQDRSPATAEFDLVVCATGLSARMLGMLEGLGFGYEPPRTLKAFQAELPVPLDLLSPPEGDVHVFGPCLPGLAFAAFVPKQGFLTLAMVGFRDLDRHDMDAFLDLPTVRAFLPPDWSRPDHICICQPRVGVTSARRPFTDRLVVIGDANCSRLYKSGIDSAYRTAAFAAEAALLHGVDRDSLGRNFHARCVREIDRDNRFGELFFHASRWTSRHPVLEEAQMYIARGHGTAARLQQEIMWGMFTGEETYGALFLRALHPALVGALAWGLVRAVLSGPPPPPSRQPAAPSGPLAPPSRQPAAPSGPLAPPSRQTAAPIPERPPSADA